MINTNVYKTIRQRKNFKTNLNFFFKGHDIQHLFVKEFTSLKKNEINIIIDFYYSNNKNYIRNILISNKILPYGAHILNELNCDKNFWKAEHDFFVIRNIKIKKLLNTIFEKLDILSCKSVTLTENFAVVLSTNSCIGCFCSGDVDLSANILEKDKIISCLNEFGFYSEEQPNKIGEYSGQSMQFCNNSFLNDGFWINVIWKPVTRAFLVQDKYEFRLEKDRLDFKIINDTRIRVLKDTSLLYFCCLHIASGHYFTLSPGLRLYFDIDRLALKGDINWNNLKLWEKADNAGIRISFVLILCNLIFNSPIPVSVFNTSLKKFRNRVLINYLYNKNNNIIQSKSSLIRRLFIELVSDNKNIFFSFFDRIYKYFIQNRK